MLWALEPWGRLLVLQWGGSGLESLGAFWSVARESGFGVELSQGLRVIHVFAC